MDDQIDDIVSQTLGFEMTAQEPLHQAGRATVVTRLEVIDHRRGGAGRVLVIPPSDLFAVSTSLQDDGRTLKIFIDEVANDK